MRLVHFIYWARQREGMNSYYVYTLGIKARRGW